MPVPDDGFIKKTPKRKARFGQYKMSESIVVIESSTVYMSIYAQKMECMTVI
jgi:hypothetical protein